MERFWSKVDKTGDCWSWTAYTNKSGYGVFRLDGKTLTSHRLSWIWANGSIPDGMHILHRCDNPKCVNPEHLWAGTHSDNMKDMARKGRWGKPRVRGERHGHSKLTNEDVRRIKILSAIGFNQGRIAAKMGVTQNAVSLIHLGKNYSHVIVTQDEIDEFEQRLYLEGLT